MPKPVPPLATASVPVQPSVCVEVAEDIVTLVSSANVCVSAVKPPREVMPAPAVIIPVTFNLPVVGSTRRRFMKALLSSVTPAQVVTRFSSLLITSSAAILFNLLFRHIYYDI